MIIILIILRICRDMGEDVVLKPSGISAVRYNER
jgi:hypothetical protein